jgi:hypothetical protein
VTPQLLPVIIHSWNSSLQSKPSLQLWLSHMQMALESQDQLDFVSCVVLAGRFQHPSERAGSTVTASYLLWVSVAQCPVLTWSHLLTRTGLLSPKYFFFALVIFQVGSCFCLGLASYPWPHKAGITGGHHHGQPFVKMGVLLTFCLCWPQTAILVSTSWDYSHVLPCLAFWVLLAQPSWPLMSSLLAWLMI